MTAVRFLAGVDKFFKFAFYFFGPALGPCLGLYGHPQVALAILITHSRAMILLSYVLPVQFIHIYLLFVIYAILGEIV